MSKNESLHDKLFRVGTIAYQVKALAAKLETCAQFLEPM